MRGFRRSLIALMAAAVGVLGVAGSAGAQSYGSTVSVTVVNCSSATVSGADWRPDDTVTITIESTPTVLGTAVVGADGTFSAEVTLSKSLGDGAHVVTVTGPGTPPPETDLPPISVSTSVAVNLTGCAEAGAGAGSLAKTGSSSMPWAAGAGALVLAGAVLAVLAYRRRSAQSLGV